MFPDQDGKRMAIKDELLELLRTDPEVREAARREIFSEELLAMPARLDLLTGAGRLIKVVRPQRHPCEDEPQLPLGWL